MRATTAVGDDVACSRPSASMLVTNFDVESARVRRRCVAADDDDARGAVEVVESTIRCVLCVVASERIRDGDAMRA